MKVFPAPLACEGTRVGKESHQEKETDLAHFAVDFPFLNALRPDQGWARENHEPQLLLFGAVCHR